MLDLAVISALSCFMQEYLEFIYGMSQITASSLRYLDIVYRGPIQTSYVISYSTMSFAQDEVFT